MILKTSLNRRWFEIKLSLSPRPDRGKIIAVANWRQNRRCRQLEPSVSIVWTMNHGSIIAILQWCLSIKLIFDCLIKTKRCDGPCWVLMQRDFCPVLWMSKWRNLPKYTPNQVIADEKNSYPQVVARLRCSWRDIQHSVYTIHKFTMSWQLHMYLWLCNIGYHWMVVNIFNYRSKTPKYIWLTAINSRHSMFWFT